MQADTDQKGGRFYSSMMFSRQIQMDALRKLRRILEHSGYSRENIIEE